jgi:nucleotide-binding universal stress UspA family protein
MGAHAPLSGSRRGASIRFGMYRKMVVGYAADRHGKDAVALARVLAAAESVQEVLIVEVRHAVHFSSAKAGARKDASAQRLAPLTADWPPNVAASTRVTSGASPADALRSAVDDEGADILVLGSSHRGFARRLVTGTTAGAIFSEANWPVVIAPEGYAGASAPVRRLGIAYDGSKESEAALSWGASVASAFSSQIRLLAIVAPAPPVETWGASVPGEAWDSGLASQQSIDAMEIMRKGMQRELAAARESIGQDHTETTVIVGDPRYELREAAEDLDMLVVGSHGGGRLAAALMHSVSRGLAHSCPVPLAVVPPGVRAAVDGSRSIIPIG